MTTARLRSFSVACCPGFARQLLIPSPAVPHPDAVPDEGTADPPFSEVPSSPPPRRPLPRLLRGSLNLQIGTFALISGLTLATGQRKLSALAACGVIALVVIRRLLASGSHGIWLGATISAVAAAMLLGVVAVCLPGGSPLATGVTLLLCGLQAHYAAALTAPDSRRYFRPSGR
ncbi:MAG: hypothetical protein R3C59_10825 [Planctomycetaceae bacterium]